MPMTKWHRFRVIDQRIVNDTPMILKRSLFFLYGFNEDLVSTDYYFRNSHFILQGFGNH